MKPLILIALAVVCILPAQAFEVPDSFSQLLERNPWDEHVYFDDAKAPADLDLQGLAGKEATIAGLMLLNAGAPARAAQAFRQSNDPQAVLFIIRYLFTEFEEATSAKNTWDTVAKPLMGRVNEQHLQMMMNRVGQLIAPKHRRYYHREQFWKDHTPLFRWHIDLLAHMAASTPKGQKFMDRVLVSTAFKSVIAPKANPQEQRDRYILPPATWPVDLLNKELQASAKERASFLGPSLDRLAPHNTSALLARHLLIRDRLIKGNADQGPSQDPAWPGACFSNEALPGLAMRGDTLKSIAEELGLITPFEGDKAPAPLLALVRSGGQIRTPINEPIPPISAKALRSIAQKLGTTARLAHRTGSPKTLKALGLTPSPNEFADILLSLESGNNLTMSALGLAWSSWSQPYPSVRFGTRLADPQTPTKNLTELPDIWTNQKGARLRAYLVGKYLLKTWGKPESLPPATVEAVALAMSQGLYPGSGLAMGSENPWVAEFHRSLTNNRDLWNALVPPVSPPNQDSAPGAPRVSGHHYVNHQRKPQFALHQISDVMADWWVRHGDWAQAGDDTSLHGASLQWDDPLDPIAYTFMHQWGERKLPENLKNFREQLTDRRFGFWERSNYLEDEDIAKATITLWAAYLRHECPPKLLPDMSARCLKKLNDNYLLGQEHTLEWWPAVPPDEPAAAYLSALKDATFLRRQADERGNHRRPALVRQAAERLDPFILSLDGESGAHWRNARNAHGADLGLPPLQRGIEEDLKDALSRLPDTLAHSELAQTIIRICEMTDAAERSRIANHLWTVTIDDFRVPYYQNPVAFSRHQTIRLALIEGKPEVVKELLKPIPYRDRKQDPFLAEPGVIALLAAHGSIETADALAALPDYGTHSLTLSWAPGNPKAVELTQWVSAEPDHRVIRSYLTHNIGPATLAYNTRGYFEAKGSTRDVSSKRQKWWDTWGEVAPDTPSAARAWALMSRWAPPPASVPLEHIRLAAQTEGVARESNGDLERYLNGNMDPRWVLYTRWLSRELSAGNPEPLKAAMPASNSYGILELIAQGLKSPSTKAYPESVSTFITQTLAHNATSERPYHDSLSIIRKLLHSRWLEKKPHSFGTLMKEIGSIDLDRHHSLISWRELTETLETLEHSLQQDILNNLVNDRFSRSILTGSGYAFDYALSKNLWTANVLRANLKEWQGQSPVQTHIDRCLGYMTLKDWEQAAAQQRKAKELLPPEDPQRLSWEVNNLAERIAKGRENQKLNALQPSTIDGSLF